LTPDLQPAEVTALGYRYRKTQAEVTALGYRYRKT
jgi:hypothetical protein